MAQPLMASTAGTSNLSNTSSMRQKPTRLPYSCHAQFGMSGLGGGSYFWRARATDAAGNVSAWSSVQSFTIDVTAPTVALGTTLARVQSVPQLSALLGDAEAADTGTVTVQLCSSSACASVLQSSTSASLANGATYTWTPSSVADATYYWRARTQDAAGNPSSSPCASSFVVDTVAP